MDLGKLKMRVGFVFLEFFHEKLRFRGKLFQRVSFGNLKFASFWALFSEK